MRKVVSVSKLHIAARFGLLSVVDKLVADDECISKFDSENSTALHEAAKEGFEDVVARLLEAKASATVKDCHGKTPLHYVQARGHTRVFDLLLEKACEEYVKGWDDEEQFLPKDRDMDEFFASYGSDQSGAVKESGQQSKETTFILACKRGKTALALALIVSGLSKTWASADGLFPVHFAIQSRSREILTFLLDFGGDPSGKTTSADQEPALHFAAKLGAYDAMVILLDYGADLMAVDAHQRTALFAALTTPETERALVVKLLLRHGVDVEAPDKDGRHILHEAARLGDMTVLEMLLSRVPDHNPKDSKGERPLDFARRAGQGAAARRLSRMD